VDFYKYKTDAIFIKTENEKSMEIFLLDKDCLPTISQEDSVGYDIRVREDIVIYPGDTKLVGSGFSAKVPKNTAMLVMPRSSSAKLKIELANTIGLIDPGYLGEIMLSIHCRDEANSPFVARKGERIAQFILVPVLTPELVDVSGTMTFEDWKSGSARGSGGFGSTGVN
jgi:dUTP pyrophosphatase